jgi:GMP synthase (glutamine-hydrolysing)
MRIHYIQHVPFETPGYIQDWAEARGQALHGTHIYRHEPLPNLSTFDWLIVLGGPMGVHDEAEFPWLTAEKQLLREAVAAEKIVLGICLGAQLLAHVLGAAVTRNHEREIGWFPINRVAGAAVGGALAALPDALEVLHWHGDTFDLPPGAVHAFRSAGCAHQAFARGNRLFGLQFHLEVTREGCQALVAHGQDELAAGGRYVQDAVAILANNGRFEAAHRRLTPLLDAIANGKGA